MEDLPDDVFSNMLAYIEDSETYVALVSMGGNVEQAVNTAINSNYFWKQKWKH